MAQTTEDLAELTRTLEWIEIDKIGLNVLIPTDMLVELRAHYARIILDIQDELTRRENRELVKVDFRGFC